MAKRAMAVGQPSTGGAVVPPSYGKPVSKPKKKVVKKRNGK